MNIFDVIIDEYIGDNVLIRNHKGEMVTAQVIKVNVVCTKTKGMVNVHIARTPDCDSWYHLFIKDHKNGYTPYLSKAFLNKADYNEYYGIHDVVWEKIN